MGLVRRTELVLLATLISAPAFAANASDNTTMAAGEPFGHIVRHGRMTTLTPEGEKPISCPSFEPPPNPEADCAFEQNAPVEVDSTISTAHGGSVEVSIENLPGYPSARRKFDLIEDTTVTIHENGLEISDPGAIHLIGSDLTIRMSEGREVSTTKTEVIVRTTRDRVADVIALSNGVELRDGRGATTTMSRGDHCQMPPTGKLKCFKPMNDPQLADALEPFLFIGGGQTESQTVHNPLLIGDAVPHKYRAPLPPPRPKNDDRQWPEQPVFINLFTHF